MPAGMVNMAVAQNKSVQQAKFNKTTVGKEILKAREESSFDKATIDMAEKLVKQDVKAFEDKSVLQFIDEVRTITDAELIERGLDPAEFKKGEGVSPDVGDLRALGSTDVENGQVIIKLYQGARPQDVIEEFYGNHFRRLSPENKKVWQAYYQQAKDAGELLTEQEYFEKQGQMFYFGYNLATDNKVVQIFRKIKFYMDDMFNKTSLDPEIRKMYEDAGFGRLRDVDAEDGDVSYSVAPIWYNKSTEAVDKINASSLKARNVKNFFRRQGVSKEEMDAIKLDEFLADYYPTNSIPVSDLKRHIARNELQLTDWGTIEGAEGLFEEGEPTYPEETRWDVVAYGESWRDTDMYAEGETPGYGSDYDATLALGEEAEFITQTIWEDIENTNSDDFAILEPKESYEVAGFQRPGRDKWMVTRIKDGAINTTEPYVEAENESDLEALFTDKYYQDLVGGDDFRTESFNYVDYDAEPDFEQGEQSTEPKYEESQQPGGEDYQEIVISIPKGEYDSGHWEGVPNPVVHTRFNTRRDKDGNKVLFIEEIQSDWHQEGAQRGYDTATTDDISRQLEIAGLVSAEYNMSIADAKLELAVTGTIEHATVDKPNQNASSKDIDKSPEKLKELLSEYDSISDKKRGAPDAPYKDFGWISLAGKRLLKYAVDNGFDKIAWTTGKQQADRSNLRRYIDRIEYVKIVAPPIPGASVADVYRIKAYSKEGGNVLKKDLSKEELEQYVGKTVARRIIDGQGEGREAIREGVDADFTDAPAVEIKTLSGLDLETGGENRIKLYDVEIANRMKRLVRGQSKLGTTRLQTEKPPNAYWLNKESDIENAIEVFEGEAENEFINIESEEANIAYSAIPDMLTQRNLTPERFNAMGKNARLSTLYQHLKDSESGGQVTHQSIDITPAVKEKYSKPMPSFSVVPASTNLKPKSLSNQKYATIRDFVKQLASEGEPARYWYEQSGQALLDITDGNVEEAKKLLSIIAITSSQMDVKSNFGQMVKGYYKAIRGEEPLAGRFPQAMSVKIQKVMDGEEWAGLKTDKFYKNLVAVIEGVTPDVTVDMWMMRAFGIDKDNPTELEYRKIEKLVQDIADDLGWEPYQVQASIWTATKARWDSIYNPMLTKAKRAGVYLGDGNWKSEQARKNFRKRVFTELKKVELTPDQISKAGFDYSDAIRQYKGRISHEVIPHPSTNTLEGIQNAPYEQQLEYHKAISDVLTDENGRDIIAKALGLPEVTTFDAPGFYEGESVPSAHLEILYLQHLPFFRW